MTELAQRIAREYGTPAVVVDLDRVERNIKRLQALCDAAGLINRPHIKTHKSPVIAAMQRDAGALAPGVAFDQHLERPSGTARRVRRGVDAHRIVDADGHLGLVHERG